MFLSRSESLGRVTALFLCSRNEPFLLFLFRDIHRHEVVCCAAPTKYIRSSPILSEVQSHTPKWPKRGSSSENGGSPPTVAPVHDATQQHPVAYTESLIGNTVACSLLATATQRTKAVRRVWYVPYRSSRRYAAKSTAVSYEEL